MPNTKHHDAKLVTVSLAGIPCQGYASGEFIRVEPEGEYYGDEQGADGETVRWATNETRATATLTLLASSPSNDLLSRLLERDRVSPNGAGVGAFEVRDGAGTSRGSSPQAWIMGQPVMSRGIEAGTTEWKIRLANYRGFVGGNLDLSGGLAG